MQPGACAGSCHARCAAQMWGCAPWHPPLFSCGLRLDTTSEQCWNSWADLELIEALKTEAGANLALIKPSEKWGRTTSAASFIPPDAWYLLLAPAWLFPPLSWVPGSGLSPLCQAWDMGFSLRPSSAWDGAGVWKAAFIHMMPEQTLECPVSAAGSSTRDAALHDPKPPLSLNNVH